MKYTIYSIDNRRERYKRAMKRHLRHWEEVETGCVNGNDPEQLKAAMEKHPYRVDWQSPTPPKVGQLGIWYSFLNAIEHAPLVTFDDDAILNQQFSATWALRSRYIPEDTDFFSLFLPRDSDYMWRPEDDVNKYVTRAYARYGGVSFYITEQGRDKIKALVERDGIRGQYDDTLYAYSKSGELNGYSSKPTDKDLVFITGHEESIVQESDFLK